VGGLDWYLKKSKAIPEDKRNGASPENLPTFTFELVKESDEARGNNLGSIGRD
jgi:hypothetical protein